MRCCGISMRSGGSSSGCRLALLLARRHPAAVRGLLLWRVTGGPYAAERLARNYYTQYIDEDRRQETLFRLPIRERHVDVWAVFGQHFVVFGVRHQPVSRLAGGARMHPVVAGDDAGRHRQRAQLARAQADHRMVGALVEGLPPALHDGNKVGRRDCHQPGAIGGIGGDDLGEMLAAADGLDGALAGEFDFLRRSQQRI
jgi:pimeloyl-ACP methyl ester carboxylesterase